MNRTRKDKVKDFILNCLKYPVKVWMCFDAKATYTTHDGFNLKRKEPFLLLGNHTYIWDVIQIQLRLWRTPCSIASQTLFAKQPTKFLFDYIGHGIPKSKGASDLRTAKRIFQAIKNGRSILIFPEGDITFTGETNYIEESTYKLIKKLNVDLVTCTFRGGYLSNPRWATGKRRKKRIHLDYHIAIRKDELPNMTVEDIEKRVKSFLYNNDYEYQRSHMYKRPGRKLAEGFENAVYICPECEALNSFETNKNEIKCTSCNTVGKMNEYGFIEGFKFDNLVDWDHYQKPLSKRLIKTEFESPARLYHADYIDESKKRVEVGKIVIKYKDKHFEISGASNEKIPFSEINNPIITLRRMLNFTYNKKNYIVKLEKHVSAFLRVIQDKY